MRMPWWVVVMGVQRPAGAKPHVRLGRVRCSKLSARRSRWVLLDADDKAGGLLPATPVRAGVRAATGLVLIFVRQRKMKRRETIRARSDEHDGQTSFS